MKRKKFYKETLVEAQKIAYARPGGWEDLAASDIDINWF